MTVSYVGENSINQTSSDPLNTFAPAGGSIGDLIVIVAGHRSDAALTGIAGFKVVEQVSTASGTTIRVGMWADFANFAGSYNMGSITKDTGVAGFVKTFRFSSDIGWQAELEPPGPYGVAREVASEVFGGTGDGYDGGIGIAGVKPTQMVVAGAMSGANTGASAHTLSLSDDPVFDTEHVASNNVQVVNADNLAAFAVGEFNVETFAGIDLTLGVAGTADAVGLIGASIDDVLGAAFGWGKLPIGG